MREIKVMNVIKKWYIEAVLFERGREERVRFSLGSDLKCTSDMMIDACHEWIEEMQSAGNGRDKILSYELYCVTERITKETIEKKENMT